jgi:hypothetical protein
MNKLVRILNTKTGVVFHRPEHIANNAKLLKTYGCIKQDYKEEKKPESEREKMLSDMVDETVNNILGKVEPTMEQTEGTFDFPGETNEEVATDIIPPTLEELKEEYELLTGKKAGNKKAETIANEIQEIKEKAKSNI